LTNFRTLVLGIPGFFEPNPSAGWGPMAQVGIERASYYLTRGLRETLDQLIDFSYLAQARPRLTVGAVNVRTGTMRYFDSRAERLGPDHILASGALRPRFPGPDRRGAVLGRRRLLQHADRSRAGRQAAPRFRDLLGQPVESVGSRARSLWDVQSRQKEIQYASRFESHLMRQTQIHQLRHVVRSSSNCCRRRFAIRSLAARLPPGVVRP